MTGNEDGKGTSMGERRIPPHPDLKPRRQGKEICLAVLPYAIVRSPPFSQFNKTLEFKSLARFVRHGSRFAQGARGVAWGFSLGR